MFERCVLCVALSMPAKFVNGRERVDSKRLYLLERHIQHQYKHWQLQQKNGSGATRSRKPTLQRVGQPNLNFEPHNAGD